MTLMLTVANGPGRCWPRTCTGTASRGGEHPDRHPLPGSSQETVTVQEIYPRYQGALVVCPGGDDPEVRLQITEALSALTGLGADKISISEGK
ncbi:MAG: hypothetical protein ACLR6W_04145 [Evtepia sp.]